MRTPPLKPFSKALAEAISAPVAGTTRRTFDELDQPMSSVTAIDAGTNLSVEVAELLAGVVSPPPETLAAVTRVPVSSAAIRAVTLKVTLAPDGSVSVPEGPPAPERGPTPPF